MVIWATFLMDEAVKETSQCDGGANILWEEEDEFAWEERAESKYLGMGRRRDGVEN